MRQISVSNLTTNFVQVNITSDVRKLSFQLSNENYRDVSSEQSLETLQSDSFNQLFNEVNLIEQFELQPKQSIQLVVLFKPVENEDEEEEESDSEGEGEQTTTRKTTLNKFNEIRGIISFQTSIVQQKTPIEQLKSNTNAKSAASSPSLHLSPLMSPHPSSNTTSRISSPQLSPQSESDKTQKERDSHHSSSALRISFVARVCRSMIKVETTELNFDECVVGQQYVKDFMIWNTSEMPALCEVTYTGDQPRILEFFDRATATPLASSIVSMTSYFQLSLRIVCSPTQTGKFEYNIRILNGNDVNNVQMINVKVSVQSEVQARTNTIITTEKLNFGDCYTDVATSQILTIKNITEKAIEIHFSSSISDEIVFEPYIEKDDKETESLLRKTITNDGKLVIASDPKTEQSNKT